MNYDYILAEVCGSKTLLVTSRVKKDRRIEAAAELTVAVPDAEGIGFLMLPCRGGDYRVETAGDEWNANVALAAASYYAAGHGVGKVRMEVSGCDDFITVDLDGDVAAAELPLPYMREKSEFSGIEGTDLVFDGIAETVVPTAEQFPSGKMRFFLISRTARYHVPAAGLVLVNAEENKVTSAVYVEKTDHLCTETVSATAAAAVVYNQLAAGDEAELTFAPEAPEGVISATALREDHEITKITVKAKITITE